MPHLTYVIPAELAGKWADNQRKYAGLVMMAEENAEKPEKPDEGDTSKPDAEKAKGGELNEGGIKALHAEREARKALEREVGELKGAKVQLDKLAELFGGKGDEGGETDLAAQLVELKAQIEADKQERARDALALSVAEKAGVTDVQDVALIKAQPTEDAMKALAERLKPSTPDPRNMRADPSQGRGRGERVGSVAEAKQARLDQINKKN